MNIAIIAHDNKKADMVAFIMKRLDYFKSKDVKLYATGTTGTHIKHAGNLEVECLKSGPLGGDAQIATLYRPNVLTSTCSRYTYVNEIM
jgi:methylglyoxal synthase